MTEVEKLALFVTSTYFGDLPEEVVAELKIRVLDTLGVAIGALDAKPILAIRKQLEEFGGNSLATLIGGGSAAPDRAAFFNGALVRYLDFMDSYLAPGETFHPSDNFSAILAAAEYANATGQEFLAALAVAYEVQARLSEAAPVRARGFDHTTQGAYAAAAGVAKALRLDPKRTAHAIAISGASNIALRVTRTGKLSNWKGLAYPNTSASATHSAFLAMRGITGPLEVFEGNKGFMQSVAGPFQVDWKIKSFQGVLSSIVKRYNAEIHSQSALEGVIELRVRNKIGGADIESVEVEIFQAAYDIIGGGEEGSKTNIRTKEEADHSLPYLIAVALLDGEVGPAQFLPERILAVDVQRLIRSIQVRPNLDFTRRFPGHMPVRIAMTLVDGRRFEVEKNDYLGFHSRPMTWAGVSQKTRGLCSRFADPATVAQLENTVARIDTTDIRQLTRVLSIPQAQPKRRSYSMTNPVQERAFAFVPINQRESKPRARGVTEIRGPYYSVMGRRYLEDVLETMGAYVDGLKFAGGSFSLMPRLRVKELIDIAHQHDVYVSTGGWIERVLCHGAEVVTRYMEEVRDLGFDIIEISKGFISLPDDDFLRLVDKAAKLGLKAKPELGIQFGAGGATAAEELEAEGTRDVEGLIRLARRCLDAGAHIIMIESEGITESVKRWRLDAPTRIINEVGLENVMFEAADPAVFEWYVKNYGSDVNLFVDHSQIVQLEALRSGIWGTKSTWGRVVSFPEAREAGEKLIKGGKRAA